MPYVIPTARWTPRRLFTHLGVIQREVNPTVPIMVSPIQASYLTREGIALPDVEAAPALAEPAPNTTDQADTIEGWQELSLELFNTATDADDIANAVKGVGITVARRIIQAREAAADNILKWPDVEELFSRSHTTALQSWAEDDDTGISNA